MKTLIAALTLGSLIAASGFVQSASAEYQLSPARERAIQECMALQNRSSHDGYEGNKRACIGTTGPAWPIMASRSNL